MNARELDDKYSASKALTNPTGDPERVCAMMRRWWEGWTLAQIAQEHGMTRQRAGQLLSWCGCTAKLLRKSRQRGAAQSQRQATRQRVFEAQLLLEHPLASRLTARQRGALLWLSQGLVLTDIARRMATTAQGVNGHIFSARMRLARLDAKLGAIAFRDQSGNQDAGIDPDDLDTSALNELLSKPSPSASSVSVPTVVDLPAKARNQTAPACPAGDAVQSVETAHPGSSSALQDEQKDVVPEVGDAGDEPTDREAVPTAPTERPRLRLSDLQNQKR